MSADNWCDCPQCMKKYAEAFHKRDDELKTAYGKVSEETYIRMREKAAQPLEGMHKGTDMLREDYTVGIENGVFTVHYKSKCELCNFKYAYEYRSDKLVT